MCLRKLSCPFFYKVVLALILISFRMFKQLHGTFGSWYHLLILLSLWVWNSFQKTTLSLKLLLCQHLILAGNLFWKLLLLDWIWFVLVSCWEPGLVLCIQILEIIISVFLNQDLFYISLDIRIKLHGYLSRSKITFLKLILLFISCKVLWNLAFDEFLSTWLQIRNPCRDLSILA